MSGVAAPLSRFLKPISFDAACHAASFLQLPPSVQSERPKGPTLQTPQGRSRYGDLHRPIWRSRAMASCSSRLSALGRAWRGEMISAGQPEKGASNDLLTALLWLTEELFYRPAQENPAIGPVVLCE